MFKFSSAFLISLTAVIGLVSCSKDKIDSPEPIVLQPAAGVYVLSEGGFGGNNSKLGLYTTVSGTYSGDFFLQQNPSITGGLGDTGNDAIIYGSKMYVIMTGSARVTVLNSANATFIKNISFLNGTVNKQPRYAAAARGKVYVTAFDGTVSAIDTVSLSIVKTISAGANPEGIAASSQYLYVANSGAFNTVPDSTVSLIDLTTETEIRKIKVGVNPNQVQISSDGKVYVSAYGDFAAKPASISVIDAATNITSVSLGTSYPYSHVRVLNTTAYFYNNYPTGGSVSKIKLYNTATASLIRNEFISDATPVTATYGINIDLNGDVYVADAGDFATPGKVICFTDGGVKKFSFSTAPGINPNKIIFKR